MCKTFERRKCQRVPVSLQMDINELFKQDNIKLVNLDVEIAVFDISKTGIGFESTSELPTGYYFNAKIELGNKEYFYSVIRIVRSVYRKDSPAIYYGAEFVGLAPFLANKIDEYSKRKQIEFCYAT